MIHCSKYSTTCPLHEALNCTFRGNPQIAFEASPRLNFFFINNTMTNPFRINLRHNCLPSQRIYHVICTEIQCKQKDIFPESNIRLFAIYINRIHTAGFLDLVSGKFHVVKTDQSIATAQLGFWSKCNVCTIRDSLCVFISRSGWLKVSCVGHAISESYSTGCHQGCLLACFCNWLDSRVL